MGKDNQMDKLEYEIPKIVDLQREQNDTEGAEWCIPGSGNSATCQPGNGAGADCNTGNGHI